MTANRQRWLFFMVSAALLLLQALCSISDRLATPWLILCIFVFGMPHGALDLLFAKHALMTRGWVGWGRFLAAYILIAVSIYIVWWQFPTFSLSAFLIVSAYHFADDVDRRFPVWLKAVHGSLMITLPALFHTATFTTLLQWVSDSAHLLEVVDGLQMIALAAGGAACVGLLAWGCHPHKKDSDALQSLFEMLTAWLIMVCLPPVLAFTVYFCLCHSPKHWARTQQFLQTSYGQLLAWPVLLATVAVAVAAVFIYSMQTSVTVHQGLIAMTFPLLAALTYPHVLLLQRARFSSHPR